MQSLRSKSSVRSARGIPPVATILVALVLLQLTGPDTGHTQDASSSAAIVQGPNGFSVNVQSADLPRVLADLGQQAGFTVVDGGRADTARARQPISLSLADASLEQLLRRLLRGENYLLVYRGGKRGTELSSHGIEQIILLSPTAGGPAAAAGGSPLAGPRVASRDGRPAGAEPPRGQAGGERPHRANPPGADPDTGGPTQSVETPPVDVQPGVFGPVGVPVPPDPQAQAGGHGLQDEAYEDDDEEED